MSGGSHNYAFRKVEEFSEQLRAWLEQREDDEPDDYVDPKLRVRFAEHLEDVAAAMRAIEWNDSGDGARDEKELIQRCLVP